MEPLDLLEKRVMILLDEVKVLRAENRKLREDALATQHKVEEITKLQASLAQERKVREQALARVDVILKRIQEAGEADASGMPGGENLLAESPDNQDNSENAPAF